MGGQNEKLAPPLHTRKGSIIQGTVEKEWSLGQRKLSEDSFKQKFTCVGQKNALN